MSAYVEGGEGGSTGRMPVTLYRGSLGTNKATRRWNPPHPPQDLGAGSAADHRASEDLEPGSAKYLSLGSRDGQERRPDSAALKRKQHAEINS